MASSNRFQLTSCCGCYSLKFGTIFSGVSTILLAIITIVLVHTLDDVRWRNITFDVDVSIVKIIYTINLIMTILITILMIVGALKRSTVMILPWVALGILLIISLFVSVLYTSISLLLNDMEVNRYLYGFTFLIGGTIVVLVYGYFWFVVYSYFQKLRQEKNHLKIGPYGKPYTYQRP